MLDENKAKKDKVTNSIIYQTKLMDQNLNELNILKNSNANLNSNNN
jgi:hypothetical protein